MNNRRCKRRNGLPDSPFPWSSKIRKLIEISKVRLDNRRIYIGGKSEIFRVTTYHPAQVIRVGREYAAIYMFKLCPPRASVLIFEGSKARQGESSAPGPAWIKHEARSAFPNCVDRLNARLRVVLLFGVTPRIRIVIYGRVYSSQIAD